MEPAPFVRMTTSNSKSLLELAYDDALAQSDDEDLTRTRLLDAAYEQFCRTGIQRSSMEEIARRANLSRITLYRKFDTKDTLVDQVLLREIRRYFIRFLDDISRADSAADRVVAGFVSSLHAIRTNPLIGGLLDAEPTLLAGSVVGNGEEMLATVRHFVAGQLRHEQEAGTISGELNTDLVAEMMVRVSASFLMFPSRLVDLDDDAQLTTVARQFLVPMLEPHTTPT